MRSATFVLAMVLLTTCLPRLHAATIRQYDAALATIDSVLAHNVRQIAAGTTPADGPPADFARRMLSGIDTVQGPDGVVYPTDKESLLSALAAADNRTASTRERMEAYQGIRRRIAFLRAEIAGLRESHALGRQYGAIARDVLGRPEFASEPTSPPNTMVRLANRFGGWLARMWHKLSFRSAPMTGMPLAWWSVALKIIGVTVIGVAFGFVVWLIVLLIRGYRGKAVIIPLQSGQEEALVEARDTNSLIALAERYAGSGDHRAAFRLVYLATLVSLDTSGVLRFDRSKTNWEYVRALQRSGRQEIYDVLVPLTREFDRIWYGLSPVGRDVYVNAVDVHYKLTKPLTAVR